MFKKLVITFLTISACPGVLPGQQIRITVPLHSELTEVQRLNRLGVEEVVRHKYEKAEMAFFKAYLYDPADPFTLNNLGYVSEIQGRTDRAAEYYKLAVKQGCESVIDRSSDAKLKGKPMMDALGTLKNMPMRINRINTYAIQLLSQNRAFEAETVLKQLLPLDPTNPFILNNLAVSEEATGDLEDALKYYDAAAASHSTQPVVVTLKHSARGKAISTVAANSAEELRKRMATMDLKQIRAGMYAARGVSALNANNWTAAQKFFNEGYASDPRSAFSLNNLGYLADRAGDLETAMAFYARAQRATDSGVTVGMASQSNARGQRLSAVASESHRVVDIALSSQISTSKPSDVSIEPELLRRDGSPEPPAELPIDPSTLPVPTIPSTP